MKVIEAGNPPADHGLELDMQGKHWHGEGVRVFTRLAIASPIPKGVYRNARPF